MFSIELEGWRQFIATLDNLPVESRTAKFMAGVATTLKNDARMNAPVKSGLLRVSIQDSHGADANGGFAEVGIANGLFYAPYMEYGTGLVHDHPNWPRERHMPFVKRDPRMDPCRRWWHTLTGSGAAATLVVSALRGPSPSAAASSLSGSCATLCLTVER